MEEDKERFYWLLYSLMDGSLAFKWKVVREYSTIDKAFEVLLSRFDKEELYRRLKSKAMEYIEISKRLGAKIITYIDREYPSLLRYIDYPPFVLYVKGDIPALPSISVVGTRKATNYGKKAVWDIVPNLARYDVCIVSGLAIGIDGEAHRATLSVNGKTLAVLSCGVDIDYPKANSILRKEILEKGGGLISEFPFGVKPNKGLFVIRNRLIAGISMATIVIESDIKGGAMITAEYCKKYGRDLFALPGDIYSLKSRGTVKLIKEGAYPITSYKDILFRYRWNLWQAENQRLDEKKNKDVLETEKEDVKAELSPEEKIVYNIVLESPRNINELHIETSIAPHILTRILLNLELKGLIEKRRGYIIAK